MFRNPLFTLILGLMGGLALGYVLAENQSVPPAVHSERSAKKPKLPVGHPPEQIAKPNNANQQVVKRAAELQKQLVGSPDDVKLMAALGNLYFDASRWSEARDWYEKTLRLNNADADVMTDLAVVYRKLKEPERALAMLDDVVKESPSHWQAWYNKVVVLHFDLSRNEDAATSLLTLESLAANNSRIPDLSSLARQIRGG